MLPSKTQVDAFHSCGYVEATASFKRLHGRFQGLCGIGARPLIIIWPAGGRQRNVTVELFRCTDSILDERFQSGMKTLAQTWGASGYQSTKLPVSFTGVSPRNARILAGYLRQMAVEAYQRRSQRIKSVLVVEGTPSDGKPVHFSGGGGSCGAVFPLKGSRDLDCVIQLDNGERYKAGYRGTKEPEIEFLRKDFATRPGHFTQISTADIRCWISTRSTTGSHRLPRHSHRISRQRSGRN